MFIIHTPQVLGHKTQPLKVKKNESKYDNYLIKLKIHNEILMVRFYFIRLDGNSYRCISKLE